MTTLREVRGSFELIPMRYAPLLAGIRSEILSCAYSELNEHSILFKALLNLVIFSSFIHTFTFYAVY